MSHPLLWSRQANASLLLQYQQSSPAPSLARPGAASDTRCCHFPTAQSHSAPTHPPFHPCKVHTWELRSRLERSKDNYSLLRTTSRLKMVLAICKWQFCRFLAVILMWYFFTVNVWETCLNSLYQIKDLSKTCSSYTNNIQRRCLLLLITAWLGTYAADVSKEVFNDACLPPFRH